MRECVEEGIIQSYYDGELSPKMMEQVAAHLAACASCTEAAREIESETLMLASAFEPELSLNIPTERLRERIDAAIAAERFQAREVVTESTGTRVRNWFAAFTASLNFTPQGAAAFASLIVLVMFAALLSIVWSRAGVTNGVDANSKLAAAYPVNPEGLGSTPPPTFVDTTNTGRTPASGANNPERRVRFYNAGYERRASNESVAVIEKPKNNPTVEPPVLNPLPEERGYLEAISSLQTAIAESGVTAMQPTLRADYERNLAVVDQAIAATRRVARLHPKDTNTAQFLYSSYQSKIDMMSAVADQTQLVATR